MFPPLLTEKEYDDIRRTLKYMVLQVLLVPSIIAVGVIVFLVGMGFLLGVPAGEMVVLFLNDGADLIVLMQIKMLGLALAIVVVWFLLSYDRVDIFACYASNNIFSRISELIRLWSSLWSRLSVLAHLLTAVPVPWTIQSTRMVSPHTRHVSGLSPQLE